MVGAPKGSTSSKVKDHLHNAGSLGEFVKVTSDTKPGCLQRRDRSLDEFRYDFFLAMKRNIVRPTFSYL